MSQPQTRTKQHSPSAVAYDGLSWMYFDNVASVAAGLTGTTVSASLPLVTGCKIFLVSAMFTAIGVGQAGGTILFNIVSGNLAAYESGETTGATQIATAGGTFLAGELVTLTIAGVATTIVVPATPTVTKVAAAMVAALQDNVTRIPETTVNDTAGISGLQFNRVFGANNAAGVLTVGALDGGAAYNTITFVCTTNSASGTWVATGATLAGGVSATGITLPVNDTFPSQGIITPAPISSSLFGNDQALAGPPLGSTSRRYAKLYQPYNWDAVFAPDTVLTLRLQTTASTGTVTNLKVGVAYKPYDTQTQSVSKVALVNAGFLPIRDLG